MTVYKVQLHSVVDSQYKFPIIIYKVFVWWTAKQLFWDKIIWFFYNKNELIQVKQVYKYLPVHLLTVQTKIVCMKNKVLKLLGISFFLSLKSQLNEEFQWWNRLKLYPFFLPKILYQCN